MKPDEKPRIERVRDLINEYNQVHAHVEANLARDSLVLELLEKHVTAAPRIIEAQRKRVVSDRALQDKVAAIKAALWAELRELEAEADKARKEKWT